MPKNRGWGQAEEGYDRDRFYVGGTDSHGHSGRARDIKMQPWLHDVMVRVADEIPAYQGQIGNVVRNAVHHQVRYDIERIEDRERREELYREFQVHADMEETGRQLNRFAEMQRYVQSCRAALTVFAESKNWMLVSQHVEKMKKRVKDGLLWEPCASEVEGLITEYTEKLNRAKT